MEKDIHGHKIDTCNKAYSSYILPSTIEAISSVADKMEAIIFIILMVSSIMLLWSAVKAFYSLWRRPKGLEQQLKQLGFKGTSYKFLFGDLKAYQRSFEEASTKSMNLSHRIVPRVMPFIDQAFKSYGKVSFFWLGTRPTVIIADPVLAKEVLSDRYGHIQKPPEHPHMKLIAMGLNTMEGEKWASRRKSVTPAFHIEKLKGMTPAFITSCVDLIKRWKKLISPQGFSEIDVWPDIQNFTADVISRTAFGSNYEEGKRIFELQKEQTILIMEALWSIHLPGSRYIPSKKNKRRTKIHKEITEKLRAVIENKMNAIRNGQSSADDLLGILLQFSESSEMTVDEVAEECKLFYFAGQETTANLLTWTMIVLAMHPRWQEKAREEILSICGRNMPSFESLNHFKIVTMILYEVLRLYPPVVQQFRYTSKETKIHDLFLPAGVKILLMTLLVHHDVQVWGEDAEEFRPERFSDGISKASKGQVAFFPFGWGPRICIGQNFAMIEAKMALAMILQNFSFQISPSYMHAPHLIITLQPQHGAQLLLHGL